jgi:hypothetical protein
VGEEPPAPGGVKGKLLRRRSSRKTPLQEPTIDEQFAAFQRTRLEHLAARREIESTPEPPLRPGHGSARLTVGLPPQAAAGGGAAAAAGAGGAWQRKCRHCDFRNHVVFCPDCNGYVCSQCTGNDICDHMCMDDLNRTDSPAHAFHSSRPSAESSAAVFQRRNTARSQSSRDYGYVEPDAVMAPLNEESEESSSRASASSGADTGAGARAVAPSPSTLDAARQAAEAAIREPSPWHHSAFPQRGAGVPLAVKTPNLTSSTAAFERGSNASNDYADIGLNDVPDEALVAPPCYDGSDVSRTPSPRDMGSAVAAEAPRRELPRYTRAARLFYEPNTETSVIRAKLIPHTNGAFLVRPSSSRQNCLILVVLFNGRIKNMTIDMRSVSVAGMGPALFDEDSMSLSSRSATSEACASEFEYIFAASIFDSLDKLVDYFSETSIAEQFPLVDTVLTRPCGSLGKETERVERGAHCWHSRFLLLLLSVS